VGHASASGSHPQLRALNKVVWARDGLSVLCGDSMGTLHLLKLHSQAVTPTPADEGRFELAIVSHQVDYSHHVPADESKYSSSSETTTPTKAGAGSMFIETHSVKSVDSDLNLLVE
jgi:hypothetical protein